MGETSPGLDVLARRKRLEQGKRESIGERAAEVDAIR